MNHYEVILPTILSHGQLCSQQAGAVPRRYQWTYMCLHSYRTMLPVRVTTHKRVSFYMCQSMKAHRGVKSLCLTKHHTKKTYPVLNEVPHHEDVWRRGNIASCILNLGNGWRWVVSFTLRPLYSRGESTGTHWIGGWVSLRVGLNAVTKEIKSLTLPGIEHRSFRP
jgi:hypothetical protein